MSAQQHRGEKDLYWICENDHEWTLVEENQECPFCAKTSN